MEVAREKRGRRSARKRSGFIDLLFKDKSKDKSYLNLKCKEETETSSPRRDGE